MDHFADIFLAYQKRGKAKDKAGPFSLLFFQRGTPYAHVEIEALDKQLAPWTAHDSPGKARADSDKDTFSIK